MDNKYQEAFNEVKEHITSKHHWWSTQDERKHLATLQELVDKESKYQALEEKLGISLLILFKALKNGVWFFIDEVNENFSFRPRLYYSDDFKCYCFEISLGSWIVKLKDYGKTWALCREDLKSE